MRIVIIGIRAQLKRKKYWTYIIRWGDCEISSTSSSSISSALKKTCPQCKMRTTCVSTKVRCFIVCGQFCEDRGSKFYSYSWWIFILCANIKQYQLWLIGLESPFWKYIILRHDNMMRFSTLVLNSKKYCQVNRVLQQFILDFLFWFTRQKSNSHNPFFANLSLFVICNPPIIPLLWGKQSSVAVAKSFSFPNNYYIEFQVILPNCIFHLHVSSGAGSQYHRRLVTSEAVTSEAAVFGLKILGLVRIPLLQEFFSVKSFSNHFEN